MRILPTVAKTGFAAFVVSLMVGLVASLGTRFAFWTVHFGHDVLYPWCLIAGVVSLLLGISWMIGAMVANDSGGARYGFVAVIGSGLVLIGPFYDYISNIGMPPIHDITTDTAHPPEFVSLVTRRQGSTNPTTYDGPNKIAFDGKQVTVSALQHKYYAKIKSVALLMSPEKLFQRAVTASYGMGWNVIAIVPDEGRIEATDTTWLFGYTDDIVIRVKPAGMGAKLDIRSKARIGNDDQGRNAERVQAFVKRLVSM
jgi:hypothetical protein